MKSKKRKSEICRLKVKKKTLFDLPVFYNYILYNRFEKGRLPSYHYDNEIQCYIDFDLFDKPISKF